MTLDQLIAKLGPDRVTVGPAPANLTYASPSTKTTAPRRPKPRLVEPEFRPPACWVIPVMTYGPNGGKIDRSAIGRSGSQRKAVARCISPRMAALLPSIDHFHRGGQIMAKFTRIGRKLDEADNLPYSMKYVKDMIALYFGAEDDDRRFRWEYANLSAKLNGVMVEIGKA